MLAAQYFFRCKKVLALIYKMSASGVDKIKISKDVKNLTTTQSEMAKTLGITQPRVHQLIVDGVILKDNSGAVLIIESLKNYYKLKAGETEEGKDGTDYWVEKAKHEAAKRKMAEICLAKVQNRMHDSVDVERVMAEMLTNLRTQLLGLPSSLAPEISGKSKEEIAKIMTKAIEARLTEISEYSPEMFTEEEVIDEEEDD